MRSYFYKWYRSQVVRPRSAKPLFPSSNLGGTSKKLSFFGTRVFLSKPTGLAYHHVVVVYIIAAGVYHHTFRCVLKICRHDDIQNFVLMICNSCGIDDIQRQAVDFSPLLCYSTLSSREVMLRIVEFSRRCVSLL